jgi:hypothetical protein
MKYFSGIQPIGAKTNIKQIKEQKKPPLIIRIKSFFNSSFIKKENK